MTEAIPQGYKQTEIGVIPEDWDLVSYDEAFIFLNTATYSRADLSKSGEVKYVHYGDIHTKWNHFLDLNKTELPCIEKNKQKNYSLLKEGDLIMADASEDYEGIGKSVEVKNLGEINAISGLHTFLMRNKNEKFVKGFLGYIHSNLLVKKQFDRLATGLKVYGVSKNNLKTVFIPTPKDPKEQSAIATALSQTDELIQKLDKLITKKKDIKKGAMQELLTGKKRLPGFSGEWEERKLGEISQIYQPETISQNKFMSEGYPVYGANGLIGLYHKYNHKTSQNIITCRGSTCGTVNRTRGKSWITGNAMVINIDSNLELNKLFFYYLLLNQDFGQCITGSGQPQIVRSPLFNYVVKYPKDTEEQSAIASVLLDMDSEIEELEQKRNKYRMIKEGMMQQLLTGRIRLKWK